MRMDKAILRHWARAFAITAALILAPAAYSEIVSGERQDYPEAADGTLFGNYLSGRVARTSRDMSAAAGFYSRALAEDPENAQILEQAFLLEAASGHWDRAVPLAEELLKQQPTHRIAKFLMGAESFRRGDFAAADEHFTVARQGPIADLTSTLARAWVQAAQGKHDRALKVLDGLSDADWAQFYQRYHRGLIADLGGKRDTARAAYAQAFKKNTSTLRVAEAYTRHAMNGKNQRLAKQILDSHIGKGVGHPLAQALKDDVEAGTVPPLLITTASAGLAEVFYGIGDALAGEGGLDMGITFLQMALLLEPQFPLANVALAEAYDTAKRYDLELEALDRIEPDSPLWPNVQIQKAFALNSLERLDEARELLEDLSAQHPEDLRPLDALGNILRSHEKYDEALEQYAKAIELVDEPDKRHWTLFYSRGVCHERLKDWPQAEVSLKKALELNPDEPLILNYLGYSWVDQGVNLKEGLELIRKAVKIKPDDGYFVDSLGWAYYRLGDMSSAVEHLERAVELKPDDPVINDHLGDVYWRVGRKLEAKYQWEQALALKPEDDEIPLIKEKIASGLPSDIETTKAAESVIPAGQKVSE
jgi:tetratricopeptide (TPR) repeat protein